MSALGSFPSRVKKPLGEGFSSLHHTTKRLLKFKKDNVDDIDKFKDKLDKSLNNNQNDSYKGDVVSSFVILYREYKNIIDEEALIHRMERAAHRRNIVFRFLTTLIVGFSIMFVYWVAHICDIPMPLMRIPQ